jgi:hypothetical protein
MTAVGMPRFLNVTVNDRAVSVLTVTGT